MSKLSTFENIFVNHGFRKCKKDDSLNFLKIRNKEYFVLRFSKKSSTMDLFYEIYDGEMNPCNSEPLKQKTLKLGFEKEDGTDFLREQLKEYRGL